LLSLSTVEAVRVVGTWSILNHKARVSGPHNTVCNEGASNLTLQRPTLHKLLVQVRRANIADQLGVLEWLTKKFPSQVKNMLKK
jgi:hypothetical protein